MAGDISTRAWRELAKEFKAHHEEAGSVCWLCRQPINYDALGHHPDSFELDHFLPRVDYPELALEWDNLRPSHYSCNRSRGKLRRESADRPADDHLVTLRHDWRVWPPKSLVNPEPEKCGV